MRAKIAAGRAAIRASRGMPRRSPEEIRERAAAKKTTKKKSTSKKTSSRD